MPYKRNLKEQECEYKGNPAGSKWGGRALEDALQPPSGQVATVQARRGKIILPNTVKTYCRRRTP
jgi:hypothetical protein